MMRAQIPRRNMARVIGIAAMPVMVGQMAGPSLGGLILTWLDWHGVSPPRPPSAASPW